MPFPYYSMPFCQPAEGVKKSASTVNPGTILLGIRIENSPYTFRVMVRGGRAGGRAGDACDGAAARPGTGCGLDRPRGSKAAGPLAGRGRQRAAAAAGARLASGPGRFQPRGGWAIPPTRPCRAACCAAGGGAEQGGVRGAQVSGQRVPAAAAKGGPGGR